MLDSTGARGILKVTCIFCPRTVQLATYAPERGHCGEELMPSGPYIGFFAWSRNDQEEEFLLGQLYKLTPRDSKTFKVEAVQLHRSADPYAYDGAELPKLGFGRGFTFWVCEGCHKLVPGHAAVQTALNEKHILHRDLYIQTQPVTQPA
jgi:hypothetical protein